MSKTILIISWLCMLCATFFYYPKWKQTKTEATISWDVSGYYIYLPAIFIFHDVRKLEWKKAIDSTYYPSTSAYQSFTHPGGNQVFKYTCGVSVLYMPFFFLAHALAPVVGATADGYSWIYQFMISVSALFYSLIGLIFLRKILLRYVDDKIVAMGLGIIVFATNYFDYGSITGAMSHSYLFCGYSILLYLIDNYYRTKRNQWFYISCGLIGLMTLIRPTELISTILLFAWNAESIAEIRERILNWMRQPSFVLIAIGLFFIFPLLQLIYWKYTAGEWIVYSYQEQGFSWLRGHHIWQGLMSYQAGWWMYSPAMVIIIPSLIYSVVKKERHFLAFTSFIILSLYLTFAWDEWTYGGSLGQRALVQHYPVMLFPIVYWVNSILNWKWKYVFYSFILFSVLYNFWMIHQAHRGGLFRGIMTNKAYFWHTLFTFKKDPDNEVLLDTNEFPITFDDQKSKPVLDTLYADSISCIGHDKTFILFDGKIPAGKLKLHALGKCSQREWDVWSMNQLIIQYLSGDRPVKSVMVRINRFLDKENEARPFDLITQSPNKSFNRLKIYLWNPGYTASGITQLKLSVSNE